MPVCSHSSDVEQIKSTLYVGGDHTPSVLVRLEVLEKDSATHETKLARWERVAWSLLCASVLAMLRLVFNLIAVHFPWLLR